MTSMMAGMLLGGVILAAPQVVFADDHEAGVPLTVSEAVGAWTVETGGRNVCVLTLGKDNSAKVPASCGDALPAGVASWAPAAHGMSLGGPDGQTLIAFSRWSNSLFVSHRSSGIDVQLKRGGPNP
jgi:hypothetical protein